MNWSEGYMIYIGIDIARKKFYYWIIDRIWTATKNLKMSSQIQTISGNYCCNMVSLKK